MTRSVRRSVILIVALVAIASWPRGSGASAHEYVRSGWWNRTNQGDVDLSAASPAPPPAGGVAVGATPEGAIAIGAVRFTVEDGEANPVLTLGVDPSSTNADADGIAILACLSGAAWTPGDDQAWDTAPSAVCSGSKGGASVLGGRAQDGKTWSFALSSLTIQGEIDVVLVPATAAGAPPVAPYQINFGAPTTGALTTSRGGSADTSAGVLPGGPRVDDAVTAGALGSHDLPKVSEPSAPAVEAFAPALPEEGQRLTPTAPAVRLGATALSDAGRDAPFTTPTWVRLLAVLLTVVACGALYDGLRREPDADDPEVRGVGGLVGPRTGPPPAL